MEAEESEMLHGEGLPEQRRIRHHGGGPQDQVGTSQRDDWHGSEST